MQNNRIWNRNVRPAEWFDAALLVLSCVAIVALFAVACFW